MKGLSPSSRTKIDVTAVSELLLDGAKPVAGQTVLEGSYGFVQSNVTVVTDTARVDAVRGEGSVVSGNR